MAFTATPPSGNRFTMDATPESGGANLGPTPVEALLSSLAACSAMDVVGMLEKMRQTIASYTIEVRWVKRSEGEFPRPVESVVVEHILTGPDLDPTAVERAVNLSVEKYCSVLATLRFSPPVESKWRIE